MEKTRLMQVLFSAVEKGDEKLTNMVGEDIRTAVENGTVEDKMNGLSYEHKGDGVVAITDKETGEVTMAERDPEGEEDEFNLWAPDAQIEGFVHPEGDGVTPGNQEGAPDENAGDHVEGGSVADQPDNLTVEEKAQMEENERHFSENSAFQKVFSRQVLVESIYSEVIESEQTSNVGDLKFEKVPGEDAVVVTDTKTGHQVKVEIDDEEIHVAELESKAFGEDEGAGRETVGYFVVGLDAENYQLIESQESAIEAAEVAAHRFEENGCTGVQIFDNIEEASEYARGLLSHLNAEDNVSDDLEVREFSDGSVYLTRSFSTNHNDLIYRMFSEAVACEGDCPSEDVIVDALKDGEEVKIEDDVIIPLREDLGLVHDTENDEYTKVEVDENGEVSYEDIDEEEADELIKEFSAIYCNEAETRFFSEREYFTDYMTRLFSEEADEEEIVEAIEDGNQIENDTEIITPVDEVTAIIEDKETGEFTKATIDEENEESIDVVPISEEEADKLTEGILVETAHSYCDESETRFFSEDEYLNDYMTRLFSEEADEEEIVEAIEDGNQIENDTEIITPVDEVTAIIEDKETGEFTKAELQGEDSEQIEVTPITEEEANELTEDLEVEKTYSLCNEAETRFFSENEYFTDYMTRLFSEEADEEEIVEAIESGEPVENDTEIITPVDETTAIIEDKENGEYTKATIEGKDDEQIDVVPVSEEEAKEMLGEEVKEDDEKEKEFSTLEKFFAEIATPAAENEAVKQEVTLLPGQSVVIVDEEGNPVEQPGEEEDKSSVEEIEDKALAAVQSIQEAAAAAEQAIQEAKAAPVENAEAPLQEAQFSQKTYTDNTADTLLTWLNGNKIG